MITERERMMTSIRAFLHDYRIFCERQNLASNDAPEALPAKVVQSSTEIVSCLTLR